MQYNKNAFLYITMRGYVFFTIMITSSSSTTWLIPTSCGLCFVLVPQTRAYLNWSASVR